MTKLGLSAQRLLYRAYQQNPEAVGVLQVPGVSGAVAQAPGATICFADQAGIRSQLPRQHLGSRWADPTVTATAATTRST